ncbi:MAG: hypothetical protein D6B28_07840 [Gammaproteobacteria bacterium]|nr:MAG: hypothetical protein D6B28_07840 [Gammaproteobacteria bacterium]
MSTESKALKKCIISGFQLEYVEELIRECRNELDVKLVIVHPDQYQLAVERLSPIPVLNRFDSRNGIFDTLDSTVTPKVVDRNIREYYSAHLETSLVMFSRMDGDGWTISCDERLRVFWDTVVTWEAFVEQNEIELFISREIPHFPSEYLLARVCERYSAKVIMSEFIEYLERRRLVTSIDDRSYDIRSDVEPSNLEDARKLIERINKHYKEAVSTWISSFNLKNRETGFLNFLRSSIYLLAYGVYKLGKERSGINIALNRKKWTQDPSRLAIAWYFFKARRRIMHLRRFYRNMCSEDLSLPEKYIYFAPNYQPEMTTVPDGNGFHNMVEVLKLLHACLPQGWKIIYKEHPATFKVPYKIFFRGHMMRSEQFFKELALDNVLIFPPEFDSFELIDRSQFIVSVNGTILLESVARGKNAIMFGNAWHEALPGVKKISMKSELDDYLQTEGWKQEIDRNRLAYALATLQEDTIPLLMLMKKRVQKRDFVASEIDIFSVKLREIINEDT